MLSIQGDFDGANPRQDGIEQLGDRKFAIHVYSETDREAHRMETRVVNDGTTPERIELDIHWPIESFTELKDCLYVRNESDDDWSLVTGTFQPGHTFLAFEVKSGRTYVCLHPHYGYDDCNAFVDSLNGSMVAKTIVGQSDNGRDIRQVTLTDPRITSTKKPVLIAARNHANETSGNYCVEGMVDYLLSDEALAKYALGKFAFHFLPMTNVDGAADGMARFTRKGGADLNRDPQWHQANCPDALPDKSFETFYRAIDTIKPAIFVNLHSYIFRHKDELYAPDDATADRFIRFMGDQIEFGKLWRRTITDQSGCAGGYCAENFGSTSMLIEIPWFGRNARTMRATGKRIVRALILMNTFDVDDHRAWGEL